MRKGKTVEEVVEAIEKRGEGSSDPVISGMSKYLDHNNNSRGSNNKCSMCGEDWDTQGWNFYNFCNPCFGIWERYRRGVSFPPAEWLEEQKQENGFYNK